MNSFSLVSRSWILPVLIVMFAWNTVADAHPFHISLAEIEFNAKSGRIEVSLKIQALDIEQAIATSSKHKFNLEKDSRADELLKAYVEEHLFVTHRDNLKRDDGSGLWQFVNSKDKSTTHFVGKELETTWLWLYLELELPAEWNLQSADALVLMNSVLLDFNEGQINTVSLRNGSHKGSFKTTSKQPWHSLPGLAPTAK